MLIIIISLLILLFLDNFFAEYLGGLDARVIDVLEWFHWLPGEGPADRLVLLILPFLCAALLQDAFARHSQHCHDVVIVFVWIILEVLESIVPV